MTGGSLNYEQPLTDDITFTTVLGYQRGKRSVNGTTGGPFRAFDYDFSDRVTQKSIEARLAGDIGAANRVVGVYGVNDPVDFLTDLGETYSAASSVRPNYRKTRTRGAVFGKG